MARDGIELRTIAHLPWIATALLPFNVGAGAKDCARVRVYGPDLQGIGRTSGTQISMFDRVIVQFQLILFAGELDSK